MVTIIDRVQVKPSSDVIIVPELTTTTNLQLTYMTFQRSVEVPEVTLLQQEPLSLDLTISLLKPTTRNTSFSSKSAG